MKPVTCAIISLFIFSLATVKLQATTPVRSIEMSVVAEQSAAGGKLSLPGPEQPVIYLALDGGYIDAGDPVAGEKPPAAPVVTRALEAALASRGYVRAGERAPTVVLTYHWGVIRPGIVPHGPHAISPNLKARLMLVAPTAQASEIEAQRVLGGSRREGVFATGSGLRPELDNILTLAADTHYFVIISAYDYASLARGENRLLWRVKARARGNSAGMNQAVPAILAASAPYLGGPDRAEFLKAPLSPPATEGKNLPAPAPALVIAAPSVEPAVRAILAQEHDAFSGTAVASWEKLALAGLVAGGKSDL